jgi:UPF0755 protein
MTLRRLVLGILGAAVLLGAAALFLPADPADGTVVSVPMGAGLGTTARALKKCGAVRSAWAFKWAARLTGHAGDIKAGDYEVPKGLNVLQTIDLLVSGRSLMQRFLVPEGQNAALIAQELEKSGIGKADAFLAAVNDPAAPARLDVPGPTLEGYLFPDTYYLPKGMNEAAIAALMVARFHQKVPDATLAEGEAIRLSPRQVMSMAALIEKEAKVEGERPLVSAVFRNRMRLKKRLESCASVRYALNKWTGRLYDKDLACASPYNTYHVFGLPPGPICSPGLPSIEAALHPAQTDALFFVVKGDGTQVFSKTYDEHLKAKARWKRKARGLDSDGE